MKYYNGKDQEGFWETFPETELDIHTHVSDAYADEEEAQEFLGEYVDYMEESLEQAEEQYYENNREAIVQQERYEQYRREY